MDTIIIKKVTIDDVKQLQNISRSTFIETFWADNSEENMSQYLDSSFSIERLSGEINNENSFFYFAIIDNKVGGYLKLNIGQAQTDIKNENWLEIERIYILKEFYGKKVGQALYEKADEIANAMNMIYIWLGVWENNERAIRFYRKNGFEPFGTHIFKLGNDEQTDVMMKKRLAG